MDYIELTPTTAHSNNYGTEYIYVVVNCDKTIDVGDSLSLTYTYNLRDFILPPNPVPVPMSTTIDWSTIDTSQAGYYLLEGVGRDKFGIYELHFGIVITVGTPSGGPNTPEAYVPYVYDDEWLDQLESYTVVKEGLTKNSTIVYDNQRNPTSITDFQYKDDISSAAAILSWSGKELTSIYIPLDQGDSVTIGYRYNDQGYRTRKTITEDIDSQVTVETIRYELIDDKVIYETNGTYGILFTYDYDGTLISFNYDDDITDQTNGDEYFYIRNQMGDITHIANSNGNVVVHYIYDAYGNITKIDSTTGYDDVAHANPYRYRGYRYDTELGLYYLNSRYYNPEIARFINADGLIGEVGQLGTTNMYAYCFNNPLMYVDTNGELAWFAALVAGITPAGWVAIAVLAVVAGIMLTTGVMEIAKEIETTSSSKNKDNYYVYTLINEYEEVFYVGITKDLDRRLKEHKNRFGEFIRMDKLHAMSESQARVIETGLILQHGTDKIIDVSPYSDMRLPYNLRKSISNRRYPGSLIINKLDSELKLWWEKLGGK